MEFELEILLTNMHSLRVKKFAQMMVLGRANGHYKLLPRMCATIVRANMRLVLFCEVGESRFNRMFVAYAANINGFKLGR